MARARNIKPAFFDNDRLGETEPLARLMFIGMWTIADFNGNLVWREKRIKAKLLPYDDCDVVKLAINLEKSGVIRFYSNGDDVFCNKTKPAQERARSWNRNTGIYRKHGATC